MGYTTDFYGKFELDRPLDDDTYNLLVGLANTRRMKRDVEKLTALYGKGDYGTEGEFFIEGKGLFGQDGDDSVINQNTPPSTQPGLWLQWVPTEDRKSMVWDGGEKFYESDKWIQYIIDSILKPRGYSLTGVVNAQGEDSDDQWHLVVVNNVVFVEDGFHEDVEYPDPEAW